MTFTGARPPSDLNLAQYCLQEQTARHPDKTALIIVKSADLSTDRLTYRELEDRVLSSAAGLLTYGFDPGARLFLRLGNSVDYVICYLAAMAVGLVPIPASALLSALECDFIIKDSGAVACLVDGTLSLPGQAASLEMIDITALPQERCAKYCASAADDPAYLIYTSGTSGRPKGVLHAHRAIWGRRPMHRDWYDLGPNDTVMHTGAFNWTYTLGTGLCDPWSVGATALLYTGQRDIEVWPAMIERFKASIMASVPALYRQLLKYADIDPQRLASLRHGLVAGEALPLDLRSAWQDRTGKPLYEALGMSEISTYVSSSPHVPVKPGSPGRPQTGRSVAILPSTGGQTPLERQMTGVIAVHRSDPGLMLGYWNRPDDTAEAFRGDWFIGGDLACMDEEGYIWFKGRNDDLMNALGYRVSPIEVENALLLDATVAEAGVAEHRLRDDLFLIAAFLVCAPGAKPDLQSLKSHLATGLADYKHPKLFYLVEQLPRTANGKLKRNALSVLVKTGEAIPLRA